MWGRIKGFLLHFFGNIIKLAITVGAIAMLFSLTPDVVADEPFVVIFFMILLTVNVTTTYDFGEFYVVVTEAGVGIAAAFILYFLVAMFVTFLLEHAAVVAGILLLLYAINRGSEVLLRPPKILYGDGRIGCNYRAYKRHFLLYRRTDSRTRFFVRSRPTNGGNRSHQHHCPCNTSRLRRLTPNKRKRQNKLSRNCV